MLTYHNNVVDFLGILTNYKHRIVNDNKKIDLKDLSLT